MGGKFINKTYVNTIDSLTTGMITKVKNANYTFNDKSPVICDWLNINKDATRFDEGTEAEYVAIGKNSPIRYNRIKDAVFYSSGIKIELGLEYDEDGLQTQQPTINGIVLPNTWIPYSGDHFILKQSGKEYVYRVNSVEFDTIDNGNNIYRFDASIDQTGKTYLFDQIIEEYRMIINNVGTGFNPIIKETIYDCIDVLDNILETLKNNYIAMFYNDAVQTFTYEGYYGKLYDPYLIEFMLRNNILSGSSEYIYVHHELPVTRTFSIEYNQTYFRALETNTKALFNNKVCKADLIDDIYSLFVSVSDQYYKIEISEDRPSTFMFQTLDSLLINNVKNNEELDVQDPKSYYNIITKYFNNKDINSNIIPILENIDFKPNPNLFYCIPMIIYIIENSIKNLMK